MRTFALVLLVFGLIAGLNAEQTSYENYKVYTVTIENENQAKIIAELENDERFDFWTRLVRSGDVNVMVSPDAQDEFEQLLGANSINYKVKIENVERVFETERIHQSHTPKSPNGRIGFTKYERYADILAYVRRLAKTHPSIVKVENIGKSTEGRDLVVVKISSGGVTKKPAILVDAGIHAREWITHAQVLYTIQELVENKKNKNLIKNVDWHIIPVINPDGYEYSHTTNRMWRKTRSKGVKCYGVDGNRNFDFHWGEVGTSSDECSQIYKGPKPFSEPETRALRDYVQKNAKLFKMYLTFHSHGQYLLYPWGYTSVLPSNAKEIQALGGQVNAAIQKVAGTKYKIGSITNALYAAAGNSVDWVMGVAGVKLAYTIELPGGGKHGFDLPPTRIMPVVKETFEGIKLYQKYVEKLHSN